MDPQRFDRIARTWATTSRRRMLAGLAATALTAVAPRRAGAACDPAACDESFDCGSKECVGLACVSFFEDAGTPCRAAANECDLAEVCTGDSVACPTDRKRPNGSACSSDGNPCTNDVCQNGQCVHLPNTGAACADDGNTCTNDVCANGTCTHPVKQDGDACPDGACCDGQCVDTQTDESHCGVCDLVCAAGTSCCAGKCVNLTSDKRNCGTCGKRCRNGSCRNGRCKKRRKKR